MRRVLDHAKTTQEAIELLDTYNVAFGPTRGGHFLIADPSGDSAVVEYHGEKAHVIRSQTSWQAMTNFHLANHTDKTDDKSYSRYQKAQKALHATRGVLSAEQAMDVLKQLSVPRTRWSVVFNMSTDEVSIALYQQYKNIYHLNRITSKETDLL
jgi:choloylglycine hydrolase